MTRASQHFRVVIIGSGFGGQCAALELRDAGIEDFRILERRSFPGGTWCQNSYPGAAVDVQSPLYSISREPYDWSQMFAAQEELEAYTQHVLTKHRLHEKLDTHTNVEQIRWNEETALWELQTSGSSDYTAQFVINASGPLSTPVIPPFPGKDSFQGASFHTNHWDHSFELRGKRVAIVGSGASAAQVIPEIAEEVAELHVFQRTPHWVLRRPDITFPGFVRTLLRFKPAYTLLRWLIYWGLELRVIGFKYSDFLLKWVAEIPARRHLKKQVKDPVLRAKLTPDFTIGCKRIILSNTLYPAFCRSNVTLHDKHDGLARIDEEGIWTTQGEHLKLDLIVYATGYDATDGVISYPVLGKNGEHLQKRWEAFPRAYLGTSIPGFPNFFIVTGPNTGIGHTSALFIIEAQMNYIGRCLREVWKQKAHCIEVKAEAEEEYTQFIHKEMERTVWKKGGCRSWYQSKSGHVIAMFPGFSFSFWWLTKRFRAQHHRITSKSKGQ